MGLPVLQRDGVRTFHGRVTKVWYDWYDEAAGERVFRVRYDDGEGEDLTYMQLELLCDLFDLDRDRNEAHGYDPCD